jgi:hypothetical protein
MLCGAGSAVDEDPSVRSVISDGAAMVDALIAGGLEQSGDGRFRADARLPSLLAASRSSCRMAQTSCADILRFEGRLPGGGGGMRRRNVGHGVSEEVSVPVVR